MRPFGDFPATVLARRAALQAAVASLVLVGPLLSVTAAAGATAAVSPPPQMQGSWRFNPDLTSKLAAKAAAEEPAPEAGKGHGGGAGRGATPMDTAHGGTGGFDKGVDPEPDKADGKARRDAVFSSLDHFAIALAPGQVTLTYRDGHSLVLKTDGGKARDAAAVGGPAQVKANWDRDGSLVVEVRPEKGVRHTETYEVSNDGKHLYVTFGFAAGFMAGEKQTLRAYDAVPAGTPAGGDGTPPAPPAPSPPPAPLAPSASSPPP